MLNNFFPKFQKFDLGSEMIVLEKKKNLSKSKSKTNKNNILLKEHEPPVSCGRRKPNPEV